LVERGVRLVADQRNQLGIIEPKRDIPEIANFFDLTQERGEGREEPNGEPRNAANGQIEPSGRATNGLSDLDTGFNPMSTKVKHVERRQIGLDICKSRNRLGIVRQIGPGMTLRRRSGNNDGTMRLTML